MERLDEIKSIIFKYKKQWFKKLKEKPELHKFFLEFTDSILKYIENPSIGLRKRVVLDNIIDPPKCVVCSTYIVKSHRESFNMFCSITCRESEAGVKIISDRRKQTNIKKYGVENPLKNEEIKCKRKETCLGKYGVENPFQSEKIKEKIKETCLEKYGVENPSQSEEIKEKVKETCLEKYGVNSPLQSEEVREKMKETCLKKYGVECAFQSEEVKEKMKETCLKKYGVEHAAQSKEVKEKMKKTCLKKYGVEHSSQSEEVKEKMKETCLKKYGVEFFSQAEEIKEKVKETCLKKYGVENPFQAEEIKGKIKETCLKKYGSETYNQSPEVRTINLEKLKIHMKEKNLQPLFSDEEYIYSQMNDELKYKCLTCNKEYSIINNPKEDRGLYYQNFLCSCSKYRSKQEIELAEFLSSLNIPFKNNDKPEGNKYELDLFVPAHNLGIEYHGLYWHCENTKSFDYHQSKYLFFKEKDIDVIQIFGNEWENKQDIIKSIIKRRLGKSDYIITSEETELKEVQCTEYLNFLEENSIYSIPSTLPTQILGLYHNDTLVQLLALNKSNIISYNTKLDYSITNGLPKLLSSLKQNLTVSLDIRYSTGQEFIDCGFTQVQLTEPNCLYTDLKEVYIIESPNSYKIYDCGSLILNYKYN